jgi:tubulin-folding cofactor B
MELHLKDGDGNLLARMLDESRDLGYYGACSGMTIHVVDTDPFSLSRDGGLDDVSRIQKYKMSDEDYDRREKTYRNWKKEKAAADPSWKPPVFSTAGGAPPTGGPEFRAQEFVDPACVEGMSVGDRCSVTPGDRRGVVAYIGPVEGLSEGYWVGVRMDEPLGKNTGSYNGKVYFEAPEKCGSFVRPSYITLGDFPPFFEVGGEGEGGDGGYCYLTSSHSLPSCCAGVWVACTAPRTCSLSEVCRGLAGRAHAALGGVGLGVLGCSWSVRVFFDALESGAAAGGERVALEEELGKALLAYVPLRLPVSIAVVPLGGLPMAKLLPQLQVGGGSCAAAQAPAQCRRTFSMQVTAINLGVLRTQLWLRRAYKSSGLTAAEDAEN